MTTVVDQLGIRPEAAGHWVALVAGLDRLNDTGRFTACQTRSTARNAPYAARRPRAARGAPSGDPAQPSEPRTVSETESGAASTTPRQAAAERGISQTTAAINDLADLDLLDDDTRHAFCTRCWPDWRPGAPFVALCGRRAVGFAGDGMVAPPNACPDCLRLFRRPCPRCGS